MNVPTPPAPPSPRSRIVLRGLLLAGIVLAADLVVPAGGSPLPRLGATAVRAAIPSQPTACVAGWRQMPVPNAAFRATPFEVVSRGGRPAWIVGGMNAGVLALRWDGSAWRQSAKTTRGHTGLVGGAVLSKRRVIAVGYRRPVADDAAGPLVAVSGVVSGAQWRDRRVQRPGGRATLTDVARLPRGMAWAVGTRLHAGRTRAYAVLWDGKRWRRDEPAQGSGSGLTAVERAPGGTTWAVGWRESSKGMPRPYLVRRASGRWVSVRAPSLPAGQAVLTDVRFRARNDGWAVGYLVARGADRHEVILLRWDGSTWSRVDLPWAADAAAMPRALALGGDGEIWIAGTQTATAAREARGFVARRRDGAWQLTLLDTPDAVRSEVMGIAATRWGAVAAAVVGSTLLVLHSCATGPDTAATRRRLRLRVSDVRARRRVPLEEDLSTDPANRAVATAIAARSSAGPLPGPVTPNGFRVRDMAAPSGLQQTTKTHRGFAADLDGNGYRDVFIGRHGGAPPRLAMNGPAGFKDAATSAFSSLDRHGCDSADVDHDGARDILCALGASRGKAVKRHELSLAPTTQAGQLARGALGIADPIGRGRSAAFLRLDADPYPEAFITNAPEREDGLPGYNRFYRNVEGHFVPAPGVGLDSSHGGECVTTGDIDDDGDEDLAYCTSLGFAGRPAGVRIMRNESGALKDRTRALDVKPIADIDLAFADVTGDGRRDLIQLSSALLRVSRRTSRGYRVVVEARLRDAIAVAAGDVDGDGAADIYVARGGRTSNERDLLLLSRRDGRRLVPVKIPHTDKGSADDVIALDYDDNGRTDFVVLNGRKGPGPVQLLAAFPD